MWKKWLLCTRIETNICIRCSVHGRQQAWTKKITEKTRETCAHILTCHETDGNQSRFHSNEHSEHLIKNQLATVFTR